MKTPLSSALGQWILLVIVLIVTLAVACLWADVSFKKNRAGIVLIASGSAASRYVTADGSVYIDDARINGADPSSFKILSSDYSADNHHVYFDGLEVVGANVSSFSILGGGDYAKDSHAVYYSGQKIEADPSSFKILDYDYAIDAKNVFFDGTPIFGADVSTFTLVHQDVNDSSNAQTYDAKDKNHEYSAGQIVK